MGYTYNKEYLIKDNAPWFPVMGEFHYSRYREDLWEESLRKMKAGGVTVVATYAFWIHHEEEEGVYDFTGCRNVGKFVALCKKVRLPIFLRIGPWCHGEVRNGGFPDWLLQKQISLRRDDPEYLLLVRRYWEALYQQVKGQMYEDGGPIIGIQIENEYGHVGGYTGEIGEQHMRTLYQMAGEVGFKVPLYTATGWGGAVTGGLLPVMAGYCEAPWDARLTELEANENYVFTNNRNDALVANDHHVSANLTFDPSAFPYITAELGGGLQPTDHRRPVPVGTDIGAMSLTKLGSGVAMLGYYMYHGGTNPKGKFSTLEESKETGYPNNVSVLSYDFRAPIRQFGQISDTYKEIKLLALFARDFGQDLVTLGAEIDPEGVQPEDLHTLRLSWRHDADHGYVFFNNYQRKRQMEDHKNVKLEGRCKKDPVHFPACDIPSGSYGFFPYHFREGEGELLSANATPLCRLRGKDGEICVVFYGDRDPAFVWKDEKRFSILFIDRASALNAWKVTLDQDYLILSENYVWEEDGKLHITGAKDTVIRCYPKLTDPSTLPDGFERCDPEEKFEVYRRKTEEERTKVTVREKESTREYRTYEIAIDAGKTWEDIILHLDFGGDNMEIFRDGEMITDSYYTGEPVQVSLRYFDFPEKLEVKIYKLEEHAPRFLERWPKMKDGCACELYGVETEELVW